MSIDSDLLAFTDDNVSNAPVCNGVYSLHKAGETIYIGKAEGVYGIRESLKAHLSGIYGPCTKQASGYRMEMHHNPSARLEELISEHRLANGLLPVCNEILGYHEVRKRPLRPGTRLKKRPS
ncbi:MAG: hypothetical protein KAI14_05000 [Dehalococcoidales bacterium]|nr:hypothetical protein [Dehalococcoidales bacterium]